ncbi:hypothetical protein TVAG_277890 [Trichomonas vaginalis G3]|uniref:Centriolar and ciliogenesis-associated protein HYLS1 C-terminal domain-containing protein n=1 Tax=Trichomonas vaginalis (strain ATCC PRA-98 / G3) TaxID=412133 RepID=A2DU30_TRIV3|nr:hypothetical protein TVAGG3_0438990 [Trichomonas vaginalis G3]EAY16023.1 hypothetical protein TVAG_277890 [Trichomonas vaginalis G3]KAI5537317.1 hypothetical protein TVAGG3_0438990 [Trichomonas vaginalis G3]|eukprot:XP_001328246.1 hypothetical protein [Trichomonas vaginalis G3]
MSKLDENEVRRLLEEKGYKNIHPETLKEFMLSLNDENDAETDSQTEEEEEVQEIKPRKRPPIKNSVSPTYQSPVKENSRISQSKGSINSKASLMKENQAPKPSKETKINSSSKQSSPKRNNPVSNSKLQNNDDDDEETAQWAKRIQDLRNKADQLDQNLQECRDIIMEDPPEDDGVEVDVPMYFGTSERKLDPYPAVKKELVGGFIRPPPVKPNKKKGPVAAKKGRRLLYEERFPDYVPPPERRRDSLRWSIRQKLAYSDPAYHN